MDCHGWRLDKAFTPSSKLCTHALISSLWGGQCTVNLMFHSSQDHSHNLGSLLSLLIKGQGGLRLQTVLLRLSHIFLCQCSYLLVSLFLYFLEMNGLHFQSLSKASAPTPRGPCLRYSGNEVTGLFLTALLCCPVAICLPIQSYVCCLGHYKEKIAH